MQTKHIKVWPIGSDLFQWTLVTRSEPRLHSLSLCNETTTYPVSITRCCSRSPSHQTGGRCDWPELKVRSKKVYAAWSPPLTAYVALFGHHSTSTEPDSQGSIPHRQFKGPPSLPVHRYWQTGAELGRSVFILSFIVSNCIQTIGCILQLVQV